MHTKTFTVSVLVSIAISACSVPDSQTPMGQAGSLETRPDEVATHEEPAEVAEKWAGNTQGVGWPEIAAPSVVKKEARRRSQADFAGSAAIGHYAAQMPIVPHPIEPLDRERYQSLQENGVKQVLQTPVSTFSIDVDTGSYANLRRILNEGRLPPQDAVRAEEMVNYFSYNDRGPDSSEVPFRVHTELGPNPWNAKTRLLRIGIKAWRPSQAETPPANLVFLVDVSGSMQAENKLPLLKRSLQMLTRHLDGEDRISLVVYAGASGVVLEPTPGDQYAKIEQAIEQLHSGGSTNGGSGIRLAYAKARESFIQGGINRVILATDGDFNVGTVNHETLIDLIETERKSGVALTTLGFGGGNYNDYLMEQLADHGNGNYAYIDSLMEARKVLVEELDSTLQIVAKDVKIQIEFNPSQVSEYRLIGYENRVLAREDFNNDRVDAGEIGAGHSVTALYEIALAGEGGERIESLRYQPQSVGKTTSKNTEVAWLRLRYKQPEDTKSQLIEHPVTKKQIKRSLAATSNDYRFAAAVAAFGQHLKGGKYLQQFGYAGILNLARGAKGGDVSGHRSDLIRLVSLARDLTPRIAATGIDSESVSR